MIDGVLLVIDDILRIWKLKASRFSNILQMNLPLSIEISKSRKVAWLPLFSTFNSSSAGYISRKSLANSPPSFKAQRESAKSCVWPACVLTYLAYFCAHVFGLLRCLRFHVFSVLASLMSLCAHMSYMLAVLKYLTCLGARVLLWHRLSYFLYTWKVIFQFQFPLFLYRFFFYSEKYLESTWTTMK